MPSGVEHRMICRQTLILVCSGAGLYRGLGVTMVRDTPSHGVYFCVYDAAREALDPGSRARGSSAPAASFTAGGHPPSQDILCTSDIGVTY